MTETTFQWISLCSDRSVSPDNNSRVSRDSRVANREDTLVWLKQWTLQFYPNLGTDDFWRLMRPDIVLYILDDRNIIKGYACISKCDRIFDDRKNAWYVDMICVDNSESGSQSGSHGCGLGSKLMREIERHALLQCVDTITLAALPQTLLFYYKLGYRFIRSIKEAEDPRLSDTCFRLIDLFKTSNLDAFQFMVDVPLARRLLVSLVKRGQTYQQLMSAKYGMDKSDQPSTNDASDLKLEIRGGVYMMKVIRHQP